MQSSSEQPLVGEEHCVTSRITAAKETTNSLAKLLSDSLLLDSLLLDSLLSDSSKSRSHSKM